MALAPWLVTWFVIAIVSTVAVLACLIALLRHLLVLGRTVKQLQDEMQPIAEDLSGNGNERATTSRRSESVVAGLCHEGSGVESRGAMPPPDTC